MKANVYHLFFIILMLSDVKAKHHFRNNVFKIKLAVEWNLITLLKALASNLSHSNLFCYPLSSSSKFTLWFDLIWFSL